jgi:hypothetical protein
VGIKTLVIKGTKKGGLSNGQNKHKNLLKNTNTNKKNFIFFNFKNDPPEQVRRLEKLRHGMHQEFFEECWWARIRFLHLSQWIRKHLFATRDGSWKCAKLLRNLRVLCFVSPPDIRVLGFRGLVKVGGSRSQLAGHPKLGRGLVNN